MNENDPLSLAQWPHHFWRRCFSFNMPLPAQIRKNPATDCTIVYLMHNCLRTTDNLALEACVMLAQKLGIPMIALVFVEGSCQLKDTEPMSVAQRKTMLQYCLRVNQLNYVKERLTKMNIPLIGITLQPHFTQLECLQRLFCTPATNRLFALFTDDYTNPLQFFTSKEFVKLQDVPLIAFDSNRIIPCSEFSLDENVEDFKRRFVIDIDSGCSDSSCINFNLLAEVQKRLQFQFCNGQFLPSVLCCDYESLQIINWEIIIKDSIAKLSFDQALTIVTQDIFTQLSRVVQSGEVPMSSSDRSLLLLAHNVGVISPQLYAHALKISPARFSEVVDEIADREYAMLQLTKFSPLLTTKSELNGLLSTNWFLIIGEHNIKIFLEPNSLFSSFHVLMHKRYSSIVPKDIRCCSTPIKSFNVLQNKFTMNFGFHMTRKETSFWILAHLVMLPTVNLGLELSLREFVVQSSCRIEESVVDVASYFLALSDVAASVSRSTSVLELVDEFDGFERHYLNTS